MSCGSSFCTAGPAASLTPQAGGYTPTAKNMDLLRRYKRGESIGFTARSSLRAKGILPRESAAYKGLYVLGPKYSGTGAEKVLKGPAFKTKKGANQKPKRRQGSRKLHSRSKTRRLPHLPRR